MGRMARRRKPRRKTYSSRQSWQPRSSRRRGPAIPGKIVALVAAGLVVAGGIAYLVILSPVLAVNQAHVEGAQTVDAKAVESTAVGAAESRFGPLVTRSVAMVDTGRVSNELKERFPDISKITVGKRWLNGLTVKIEERQQALLWQSKDQYYLVDRQGTAYAKSQPRTDLVSVVDSTGLPVDEGKPVAGSSFIRILERIQQGMKDAGYEVTQFRIPETTFEVQAVTKQGWYALYDTARNVDTQTAALKTAVGASKPAQYADLRVAGRVYVR